MDLYSSVTELRGVGKAKAQSLAKAGIGTIYDLVHHYPRAYQNRNEIMTVAEASLKCRTDLSCPPSAFILTIASEPKVSMIRRSMTLIKLKAFDESGVCELIYFNQPFLKDVFHTGETFRFWGRPVLDGGRLKLSSPVYEIYSPDTLLPPIVPVYPLSQGLSQKFISGLIRESLKIAAAEICDHIPSSILSRCGLCTLSFALRNIHFPQSLEALEAA